MHCHFPNEVCVNQNLYRGMILCNAPVCGWLGRQVPTRFEKIKAMPIDEFTDWLISHDDITERNGRLSKDELLEWLSKQDEEV